MAVAVLGGRRMKLISGVSMLSALPMKVLSREMIPIVIGVKRTNHAMGMHKKQNLLISKLKPIFAFHRVLHKCLLRLK
jgi:hypothetical protein